MKNIKIHAVYSGTSFTWNLYLFMGNYEYLEWCVWWYWARNNHKVKVILSLFSS